MSDLGELDLLRDEARRLVLRAEGIVQLLTENGACEGHRLMAAQGLVAMRRLEQMIERGKARAAFEARPYAADQPPPAKRAWWPVRSWRSRDAGIQA
ncbi:hypothetical protein ACRBEV_04345 [Methylobacterium phyllosphaerae]